MEIKIEKSRNKFKDTYYCLEVKSQKQISKENYKTIIDAIESISEILDPIIDSLPHDEGNK